MKSTLLTSLTIAAALGLAVAAVPAAAQEDLAKSSGCLNCHAIDAKKMAPSFKDKADAEATLTAKLAAGTGHPAVKAKPEDVKALVKWVLAM
jgi:cytochrome c